MVILILFITILASIVSLRISSGTFSIRYINGINYIFYRQMLIGALIGSFLISLNKEFERWYILDWHYDTRFWGFVSVCYSIVVILTTHAVLSHFLIKNRKYNISDNLSLNSVAIVQFYLFFITAFGSLYIFSNSSSWPMLEAIRGNGIAALEGRIAFRNNFTGSDFIKNIVCFMGASVYLYISFSRYLIYKDGVLHLLASFALSVFIYTYNSQKGAVLNVFIGVLIIFCIVRGKIPFFWFVLSFLIGIVSIVFMFWVVKGIPIENLVGSGSQLIIGRLIFGNIEGYFSSLQLYPDVITSESQFVGLPAILQDVFLGQVQEPSKLTLMKYFDYSGVSNGTSGYITSYFMSEAWANYGLLGIIFSPFIVAINLFIVDYILYKYGVNVFSLSFYAVMYLQFQLHGEFVGFLYFKYYLYIAVFMLPLLAFFYLHRMFVEVN